MNKVGEKSYLWSENFAFMRLKKLLLINFKNLPQAEITLADGINCFVGDNGAGKTNILDAVHYLSMSKSAFTMTDGQSVHHGEEFFVTEGSYLTDTGAMELVNCSFSRKGGKVLKRNGKEYERIADHVGGFPVVISSPRDTELIMDAAEERRRWLNAFLSQLDHSYLDATMRYNRLLAERNTLLKQGEMLIPELLDVIDERLAEQGERVAATRREVLERLAPIVERLYGEIAGEKESVELAYRSELNNAPLLDILRVNRAKDCVMGYTTSGVHRDDATMTIGGYPLRKYGSQGQQKSFLLALKLAQYLLLHERLGERPLLLLDDLFDKLDEDRLQRLMTITSGEEFGQVFITDCNRERIISVLQRSGLDFKLFAVADGEVTEEDI